MKRFVAVLLLSVFACITQAQQATLPAPVKGDPRVSEIVDVVAAHFDTFKVRSYVAELSSRVPVSEDRPAQNSVYRFELHGETGFRIEREPNPAVLARLGFDNKGKGLGWKGLAFAPGADTVKSVESQLEDNGDGFQSEGKRAMATGYNKFAGCDPIASLFVSSTYHMGDFDVHPRKGNQRFDAYIAGSYYGSSFVLHSETAKTVEIDWMNRNRSLGAVTPSYRLVLDKARNLFPVKAIIFQKGSALPLIETEVIEWATTDGFEHPALIRKMTYERTKTSEAKPYARTDYRIGEFSLSSSSDRERYATLPFKDPSTVRKIDEQAARNATMDSLRAATQPAK